MEVYKSCYQRNKKLFQSRIEIISTERALCRFLHPLFDTAPVKDMLAGQLLDELVLLEPLDADRAHLRTLLHDQGFYSIGSVHRFGLTQQAGQHGNL
jgi:hypothetical protein